MMQQQVDILVYPDSDSASGTGLALPRFSQTTSTDYDTATVSALPRYKSFLISMQLKF